MYVLTTKICRRLRHHHHLRIQNCFDVYSALYLAQLRVRIKFNGHAFCNVYMKNAVSIVPAKTYRPSSMSAKRLAIPFTVNSCEVDGIFVFSTLHSTRSCCTCNISLWDKLSLWGTSKLNDISFYDIAKALIHLQASQHLFEFHVRVSLLVGNL